MSCCARGAGRGRAGEWLAEWESVGGCRLTDCAVVEGKWEVWAAGAATRRCRRGGRVTRHARTLEMAPHTPGAGRTALRSDRTRA